MPRGRPRWPRPAPAWLRPAGSAPARAPSCRAHARKFPPRLFRSPHGRRRSPCQPRASLCRPTARRSSAVSPRRTARMRSAAAISSRLPALAAVSGAVRPPPSPAGPRRRRGRRGRRRGDTGRAAAAPGCPASRPGRRRPRRRGDGPRHQVDGPVQVARLSAQHVPFREPCPQVGQPGRKVRRIRFGQRHGLRVGGDRALQLISARGLLVTPRQRDAEIVQPARALGGHFSGQERRLGEDLGRLLQVIWTPPGQQRGAKVRQRRRAPSASRAAAAAASSRAAISGRGPPPDPGSRRNVSGRAGPGQGCSAPLTGPDATIRRARRPARRAPRPRQVRAAAGRGELAVGRRALVDQVRHLFGVGAQAGHRFVGSVSLARAIIAWWNRYVAAVSGSPSWSARSASAVSRSSAASLVSSG